MDNNKAIKQQNKIMEEELMLKFIDAVIEKSGLELPEDFRIEYRERLLSNLKKKIWLMMADELADEKLKEFVELTGEIGDSEKIEEEKQAAILNFFRSNVNDFDVKVLKIMDKFGKEFLEDANNLS